MIIVENDLFLRTKLIARRDAFGVRFLGYWCEVLNCHHFSNFHKMMFVIKHSSLTHATTSGINRKAL